MEILELENVANLMLFLQACLFSEPYQPNVVFVGHIGLQHVLDPIYPIYHDPIYHDLEINKFYAFMSMVVGWAKTNSK